MTEEILNVDQVRQRAQDCIGKSMKDIDLHMFAGWKVYIRKEGVTYTEKVDKPNTVYIYIDSTSEKFVSFRIQE